MVLLVPLVLGVLQVGFVLHVRNTLTAAAADGARVAARADGSADSGADRTREAISRALSPRHARQVTVTTEKVAGQPVVVVRAESTVPALGVFGPQMDVSGTGRAILEPRL